jgi:D-arabinose 1-dehydrogenase-like Zn-dependent alcohol dehydrogenase
MGDLANPGVREIADRIVRECGESPTPEELVDASLDVVGPVTVSDDTRSSLIEVVSRDGELELGGYPNEDQDRLMRDLLRMIVSSREYQLV